MREEIRRCFTEKGYDKKILPATMEGAVIRYADIIAYTRSDILDGFRLKDVNGNKIINNILPIICKVKFKSLISLLFSANTFIFLLFLNI